MLNEIVHVMLDEPGFNGAFEGLECLNLAIPCDFWAKSATVFCFLNTCEWGLVYLCRCRIDDAFLFIWVEYLF